MIYNRNRDFFATKPELPLPIGSLDRTGKVLKKPCFPPDQMTWW
jgi:hypothetical protein